MGRFKRKSVLIILLAGIFLLTGCNKIKVSSFRASEGKSGSEVTVVPDSGKNKAKAETSINNSEGKSTSASASATPTSAPVVAPTANKELQVYNVNAKTGEIEPATAMVKSDSKISAQLVVSTVIEALADQSIDIGINQVTEDKDEVIVDFQKDKTPYTNMGSGYEAAILNAFAQSLFDNLKDCNKVIYRVEGKAYSSGTFEMKINEPYMKR
jgi:hypothetical protein